jgi:hypothetical protein
MRLSVTLTLCLAVLSWPAAALSNGFVGSQACVDCHPDEHENYSKYAAKAKSWKSIAVMASDLKPHELKECYECHTTGYGQGGFVSIEQTPELANVGCESCHGPGEAHAESGDPADITSPTDVSQCESCHTSDRVSAFKYKPVLRAGGH